MIVMHMAPRCLNTSSYRAIWTHYKSNSVIFTKKNPGTGLGSGLGPGPGPRPGADPSLDGWLAGRARLAPTGGHRWGGAGTGGR